jgi:hypothetical protein
MLHRDPKVWGEDPGRFDPDRFAPEAAAKLPADARKPFGTGQRACIGSQFALAEAHLFLASALQRLDLTAHDPSYQLKIKETLTFKPDGFFIHAKPRGTQDFKLRSVVAAPSRPLKALHVAWPSCGAPPLAEIAAIEAAVDPWSGSP